MKHASESSARSIEPERPESHLVVGIGASAGGLAAYKSFLANMPSESGMSFVLVQHLDPHHASMLVELLAPHTAMAVTQAQDGETVAPNHVYIIPPDATLSIRDGALRVTTPAPAREHRRPIDTFFTSLAEDQKDCAVSIVLSGVGSDGTAGLRAVKANGGLTMAQAEFDHTAMPGMPMSAAATGLVDHVVPVEAMPEKLLAHKEKVRAARDWTDAQASPEDWTEHLSIVAAALRHAVGHDFSGYKENTLIRRVQRRMQALGIGAVAAYVARLGTDPREGDLLFRELLIGVTRFFRDPEAFEALSATLFPTLLEDRDPDEPIRVWVPGCATGEEAYSLAILLKEAMTAAHADAKVQIFGTDLDANAIAVARAARYRKPVDGVSPNRLKKWFVDEGDVCSPAKAIREMCVFSSHSLIRDPPFSKLDLVSCRNVLIYLNSELQHRIIQTFHYALKPGGVLWLGPSEGATRGADLFDVLDKKHRILKRRENGGSPFLGSRPLAATAQTPPSAPRPAVFDDGIDRSARRVIEPYAPVYFVIDRKHDVVRFSGGETGRYLEPSAGAASLNLFSMLHRTLRPVVRSAVASVERERRGVVEEASLPDGRSRALSLIVEPIEAGLVVVALRELAPAGGDGALGRRDARRPTIFGWRVWPLASGASAPVSEAERDSATEHELRAAKGQLKAAVNELETYMEEAKSATEEMQSVNEELQSTNEELETSKEEMQSINEELQTVNGELQSKNAALARANNDLQNLLDSTQIATLFLDRDLRIRNFTPAMTAVFHVRAADLGRPIVEIVSKLNYADLMRDAEEVQRTLGMIEREVQPKNGDDSAFLLRIRPYRTLDNRLDGVVLTFVDITGPKRVEEALLENQQRLKFTLESAKGGDWDLDLLTGKAQCSFRHDQCFGATEPIPDWSYEKFLACVHPDDRANEDRKFRAAIASGQDWSIDCRVVWPDGSVHWIESSGKNYRYAAGKPARMLGLVHDVTERKRAEEAMAHLSAIVTSSDDAIISKDLRGIIQSWNGGAQRLFGYTAEEAIGKPVTLLIPRERHDEEPGILERISRGESVDHYETVRLRKDGRLVDVSLTVSPLRDAAGRVIGAAKIARDITDRQERDEHLKVVMHELSHRAKNLLLVVQSMASQTARTSPSTEAFLERFNARIQGLARSHDLLADTAWTGAALDKIVHRHLQPFADGDADRLEVGGPPVVLSSRAAQAIGLALHELATNASKYGALSTAEGRVAVEWTMAGTDGARRFCMSWRERGGPPVEPPQHIGFGRILIERLTAQQLGGAAELMFASQGVTWTLEAPAAEVLTAEDEATGG